MSDGHLCVTPSERVAGRNIAIDVFFRTMAQVHEERAVCIVMSGTGSDGAVGLTSVKEHGGISMAETPEDAEHDGMPRAAIATGAWSTSCCPRPACRSGWSTSGKARARSSFP
jgi:two-component system CheB/CheR fusion protein